MMALWDKTPDEFTETVVKTEDGWSFVEFESPRDHKPVPYTWLGKYPSGAARLVQLKALIQQLQSGGDRLPRLHIQLLWERELERLAVWEAKRRQ